MHAHEHMPARNLLLRIAYDGTDYFGWQIQPGLPTIQGVLTDALSSLTGEAVIVHGAGRTDAGVHALAQAATVRLASPIPTANLLDALNDRLPESIRITSVHDVPPEFHARHHAISKTYRYRIYRQRICPPMLARYVYAYWAPLDTVAMGEAAARLTGTHDFRSFASSDPSYDTPGKSFLRTIYASEIAQCNSEIHYTVTGNGFLNHMVRNIVGTLLLVGTRRISPSDVSAILAARDRAAAGPTAPARGLHLIAIQYPGDSRASA